MHPTPTYQPTNEPITTTTQIEVFFFLVEIHQSHSRKSFAYRLFADSFFFLWFHLEAII